VDGSGTGVEYGIRVCMILAAAYKGGYTLVTLPRIVTPYRDSVDGTRDRVTYQKLVTRLRYGLFRCAVGIWPSHQRDDVTLHVHTRSGRNRIIPLMRQPNTDSTPKKTSNVTA